MVDLLSNKDFDLAILGCGWSGVTVALRLIEADFPGDRVICIDKTLAGGGLMGSEEIKGFTFDTGGSHVIFSRDKNTLEYMLSLLSSSGVGYIGHNRSSYVLLNDKFIPYPFENGIWVLDKDTRAKILVDLMESLLEIKCNSAWTPSNFLEWIYGAFGKTLADLYLVPYNEKIWKRDLSSMDSDWVYTPGRLPLPDWRTVIKAGVGMETKGYIEQSRFYYPYKGGIKSLYKAAYNKIRGKIKILTGTSIQSLYKRNGKWVINGTIEAGKIVSTIPLVELAEITKDTLGFRNLADSLDYNSVVTVGVALKGEAPRMHWIYVPDKSIIFHRYAWISNYSPNNAPKGHSSIIAEITLKPKEIYNKDEIETKVIDGLKSVGIIKESGSNLLFTESWYNKYGYPIYTKNHSHIRDKITNLLHSQNIYPFGRWGLWHYWNMDKILAETKSFLRLVLK